MSKVRVALMVLTMTDLSLLLIPASACWIYGLRARSFRW